MTKPIGSLLFILFPLLLFNFGGNLRFVEGVVGQQKSWCIAKYTATGNQLVDVIQFACSYIGNCSMIKPGGACFYPNNIIAHASAVMNIYYKLFKKNPWNCDFNGAALTVITDPSYDKCIYE
ncbi:putative glucan endo-1,3-beta-D-glucosidase [Lupinus albus]|uniref:Putative glucan endo-1,3-beta-D-glucosidase n=1 Tax=Lupinus albus TaxID=3870 RepID=A0A6A4QAW3_LUPAL|nr:putative glucan endo-1,3-beta-D-glucosidase [Lupinus albus]